MSNGFMSRDELKRRFTRSQTRIVIPAWQKGDHVRHKGSGIAGRLVDMETAGGELWKMKPDHHRSCVLVHACDLEMVLQAADHVSG